MVLESIKLWQHKIAHSIFELNEIPYKETFWNKISEICGSIFFFFQKNFSPLNTIIILNAMQKKKNGSYFGLMEIHNHNFSIKTQ